MCFNKVEQPLEHFSKAGDAISQILIKVEYFFFNSAYTLLSLFFIIFKRYCLNFNNVVYKVAKQGHETAEIDSV